MIAARAHAPQAVSARMASEETRALSAKVRAALAKALSEQRRAALASCKVRSARVRASGDAVDVEVVVDALEHSFTLCVMHQLERERESAPDVVAPAAASSARATVPAATSALPSNSVGARGRAEAEALFWRYQMVTILR